MRIFTVPSVCEVCNEGGMAMPRDAAAEWTGARLYHRDPEVCAANLERQRRKAERREETRELTVW